MTIDAQNIGRYLPVSAIIFGHLFVVSDAITSTYSSLILFERLQFSHDPWVRSSLFESHNTCPQIHEGNWLRVAEYSLFI